jgi:beta-mannosidase
MQLKRSLLASWWMGSDSGESRPPDEAGGCAIPGPMTAAAALRALGQWQPGGAPRDFDAQAWWFRGRFDAPEQGATVLGLDGVATRAQVWLNGERVVDSPSMFVRHRVDAAPLLRTRGNELLIRCASLTHELKARKPRPRWRAPMVAHQQLRWWRTTVLGRTPGWSLPAAPVGPWGDVWMASPELVAALESLQLRTRLDGGDGIVECSCDVEGELRLTRGAQTVSARLGRHSASRVPGVELWWPHTHGEPAVYEASLLVAGHEVAIGPVGFRTLEIDKRDGGFAVRVNGVPVFCRGAVWTPLDAVSLRASPEDYRRALAQVRGGGMNMLRVAGTTVYEDDAFYQACDRAGVLVWQDFMFANMDYPAGDAAFDAAVQTEVRQQLQRLHAHPCLAVLCGNSEAEQQAAMWGAPRDAWQQALFHETIPALCEQLAPGVEYWPSSAHGGALAQQPDTGTTSYYGVGAYLRPIEDARRSGLHFATECLAFANVPSPGALSRMPGGAAVRPHHPAWKERTPRDLGAGWDFEDVRDHYLERLFDVNARELRSTDVERYLQLSRLATGEVMARTMAEWRRPSSSCNGALLLMLRDFWPGAGWGLLDEQGGPKACWHALKRAIAPVTVVVTDEGMNGLAAHVINESAQARTLRLAMRAWRGGDVQVAEGGCAVELAPRESRTVPLSSLLDYFMDLNWSHRFGPPPCDAVSCSLVDDAGAPVARTHWLCNPRALGSLPDPGLRVQVHRQSDGAWQAHVSTESLAWGVHFDCEGLVPDDDWFHLAPGEEARVMLRGTPAPHSRVSVKAIHSSRAAVADWESR